MTSCETHESLIPELIFPLTVEERSSETVTMRVNEQPYPVLASHLKVRGPTFENNRDQNLKLMEPVLEPSPRRATAAASATSIGIRRAAS